MINENIIDDAIDFYNIDFKYKEKCYKVIEEINNSEELMKSFCNVYTKLYELTFDSIIKYWDIKNLAELFVDNISPFVTNIMVICGYKIHKENMHKHNFSDEQINIHKKRVKECFESDLTNRGYSGIRISQMLWAIYFIRTKIIEIGSLQFELESDSVVKIHIPKHADLRLEEVEKSIERARKKIGNKNISFICESWLLSNQICNLIDKDTNIYKFYSLFNINDGKECIEDILNFVYGIDSCKDYAMLSTNTSLQKEIKNNY